MRALSIPQPWADLVIRGVKTLEVRSWFAKHSGGRIAIHASANIELKKVERLWADDRGVAECFADEGWIDVDDLRALPRSAILGSVELRGVHRGRAVLAAQAAAGPTNWIEDALETAVRDPVTGELRPGPAPARTLPVDIPLDGWVFGFARALAVEPITGIEGQQHLWSLTPGLAAELGAREARARSGSWARPVPSAERVRLARTAWRERFESEERRHAAALILEAAEEHVNAVFRLDDEDAERMLQEQLRKLSGEPGAMGPDGRAWVRVPKALRALFGGATRVPATQFEADLRLLMYRVQRKERSDAALAKLFADATARLREGLAREAAGLSTRSALEAEVKREFLREWLAAEDALARGDRMIRVPEY